MIEFRPKKFNHSAGLSVFCNMFAFKIDLWKFILKIKGIYLLDILVLANIRDNM